MVFGQLLPPGWDQLFQLGGMAAVAFILLWHFLTNSKQVERNNRMSAITNLTNQSFFLTFTMAARIDNDCEKNEHENCRRLHAAFTEALKAIEKQRIELEREMDKK